MDSLFFVQSSGTTADGSNSKYQGQLHQDLMLVDRGLLHDVVTVDHHYTLSGDALTLLEVGQYRHQEKR